VTDIVGNILAVHIHAANIHDTKGGCYVLAKAKKKYPSIKAACADEGYCGTFKRLIEQAFGVRVDISKQIKPKFEVLPKRWRVERTFSWLGNSPRLSKDYEIKTSSEKNFIFISHLHTLLNRL
jgi:transposase